LTPSPAKHRIFKRGAGNAPIQLTPPIFTFPVALSSAHDAPEDVFGSRIPRRCKYDGYTTDSESDGDDEQSQLQSDDFVEDPQFSEFSFVNVPAGKLIDPDSDGDMPGLEEVDVTEDEASGMSDSGDEGLPPSPLSKTKILPSPARHEQERVNGAKPKISAYWKVETIEEKVVRVEREARHC
jgi:hypothetical protein